MMGGPKTMPSQLIISLIAVLSLCGSIGIVSAGMSPDCKLGVLARVPTGGIRAWVKILNTGLVQTSVVVYNVDSLPGGAQCLQRGGLKYHIHSRCVSADHLTWGIGPNQCSRYYTGGHWDPTIACGPFSDNPLCRHNGGCVWPSSAADVYIDHYPFPDREYYSNLPARLYGPLGPEGPTGSSDQPSTSSFNGPVGSDDPPSTSWFPYYQCSARMFKRNPFVCEVGDLSTKYGKEHSRTRMYGKKLVFYQQAKDMMLKDTCLLVNRSVVFRCGDGTPAFCAEFQPLHHD